MYSIVFKAIDAGFHIESRTHLISRKALGNLERAMEDGKELLRRAKGSFGIVLSHTLDCSNAFLIGARGQTMSVGFYPHLGMVLFGSESAATKAAMALRAEEDDDGLDASKLGGSSSAGASFDLRTNALKGSFRLELDDLPVGQALKAARAQLRRRLWIRGRELHAQRRRDVVFLAADLRHREHRNQGLASAVGGPERRAGPSLGRRRFAETQPGFPIY